MVRQIDHQVERLMFFSDAVFAIAITLLVIELKVPHLASISNAALLEAALPLIAKLVGFLVSFFVIAAFWAAHHRAFAWVDHTNPQLVWRNLRYLMFIAFLPFPTAVMSEYAFVPYAALFYTGVLALAAFQHIRLWHYALYTPGIVRADAPKAEIKVHMRRCYSVLASVLIAMPVALIYPPASLAVLLLIPAVIRLAMLKVFDRVRQPKPATANAPASAAQPELAA